MFGLSFLNPVFLSSGALAALIPLLLHLIKRDRASRRMLPTLRFLVGANQQVTKQQRLRQLLLLLLRMAVLIMLGVIFARPLLEGQAEVPLVTGQPKSLVLLIDQSYSMGYEDHLQQAKARALEILQQVNRQDQVAVIGFSEYGTVLQELATTQWSPQALINTLTLTNRTTDYIEPLRLADDQLQGSPFADKQIYLISDFQRIGLANLDGHWKLSPQVLLKPVQIGQGEMENLTVMDLQILGTAPTPGKQSAAQSIMIQVKNFGLVRQEGVNLDLYLNNERVAQKRVDLLPRSAAVVTLPLDRLAGKGGNRGYLVLEEDGLVMDNYFYFAWDTPLPVSVLAVENGPGKKGKRSPLFYLKRVLDLYQRPPLVLRTVTRRALQRMPLASYQILILANVSLTHPGLIKRLDSYVRQGGMLLLAMGPQVDQVAFNRHLGKLAPATLQAPPLGPIDKNQFLLLAQVDYQHPIFRPFTGPHQGDFGSARFYRQIPAQPKPKANILARYDDATPALLAWDYGRGKVVLFTSTFDTEWNDLPIHAIFVPFVHRLTDYLLGHIKGVETLEKTRPYHQVGDVIPVRTAHPARVVHPSGRVTTVETGPDGWGFFSETDEAGIYQIQEGEQKRYFAVNLKREESDLVTIDPEELAGLLSNPYAASEERLALESDHQKARKEALERRQKLWWYLALVLIGMILGETLLANRTHR